MKVVITHPDKLLFPKSKIKKQELADYYRTVSKWMLPLIKDRPISMKRYPQGIAKIGFFQKNVPEGHPAWIKTVRVGREGKESIQMLLCNELPTLLWLANQNCITPHIWLSRIDKPHTPDRLIFDLDPPPKGGFQAVAHGAFALKEILEKKLKLKTFVNVTGSKGVHIVVPIKREYDFDKVRSFARAIASYLAKKEPNKFTTEVRKEKRRGRVYIDVVRNAFGQTVVAPYAVRALEGASVAAPISWEELKNRSLKSNSFTIRNIKSRLRKNPWASLERSSKSLTQAMKLIKVD
ncbi:MAG TPA: non-homologous end-joining DNA ligase [Rhabdochlamydiaceae bacterium]|nr:non-homologous end-joining DNA ligase [Rhabdochlamydiaceae bacterium]